MKQLDKDMDEILADYKNCAYASEIAQDTELKGLSIFGWQLPETIDPSYIEKTLYENDGYMAFYKDDKFGMICAKASPVSAEVDIYGRPARAVLTGANGKYRKECPIYYGDIEIPNACVLLSNNDLQLSTKNIMSRHIERMFDIDRSIDINLMVNKIPFIFEGWDKDQLTPKIIVRALLSNQYFIKAKMGTADKIDVVKTDAPFLVNDLIQARQAEDGERLTALGVNNVQFEKKERMVTDEVNANAEKINVSLWQGFKNRKKSCDLLNKLYPDAKASVFLNIATPDAPIGEDTVNTQDKPQDGSTSPADAEQGENK
jgi:hypothetical protein